MGIFSVKGSEAFDQRIQRDLDTIATEVQQVPNVQALVLMGGYGRGEGTPFIRGHEQLPFNDYDLIVVGQGPRKQMQKRFHELEAKLSVQLDLPVDLYYHNTSSLASAEFSLMNYELRNGHRVVWGEQDILQLMPNYCLHSMPLSEGARLLLNRGTLLLMLQNQHQSLNHLTGDERLEAIKYLAKADLALGDCLLLAMGRYSVSYVEKREKIKGIELLDELQIVPKLYLGAIDFREWGDPEAFADVDLDARFRESKEALVQFFLWFESRRLGLQLESTQAYVDRLSLDTQQPQGQLKSLALNLLLLGKGSLSPSPRWLLHHPRYRLFPALLLLLSREDSDLAGRLLGTSGDWGHLTDVFFKLRDRLS